MFVTESIRTVDLSQIMINDKKLLVELQTGIKFLKMRQAWTKIFMQWTLHHLYSPNTEDEACSQASSSMSIDKLYAVTPDLDFRQYNVSIY